MDARDNVAVALRALAVGEVIQAEGRSIRVRERIPTGHKLALGPIAEGEYVIKYGEQVGRMKTGVAEGQHVHVHNVHDITEERCLEERRKLGE